MIEFLCSRPFQIHFLSGQLAGGTEVTSGHRERAERCNLYVTSAAN